MKSLIKIAVLAIIAILAYNYFFGTEEEKETTERIVEQVKDLGNSVADFVKSEKEKFDEGKYDELKEKIKDAASKIKSTINELTAEDIDALKDQKRQLEDSMKDLESRAAEEGRSVKEELNEMVADLEELIREAEERYK